MVIDPFRPQSNPTLVSRGPSRPVESGDAVSTRPAAAENQSITGTLPALQANEIDPLMLSLTAMISGNPINALSALSPIDTDRVARLLVPEEAG